MDISLRQALESDTEFLVRLREMTMGKYLKAAGMAVSREALLERVNYKFEGGQIIEMDGIPVGLFKTEYLAEKNQWFLVQIQLHPGYQNLKIGRRLLLRLLDTASQTGSSVGLSVLKNNPAQNLYTQLGFETVGENDVEFDMVRRA